MKTEKLKNGLICVSVSVDAEDFWINNCGCLRYSIDKGRRSSVIEPMTLGFYAEKDNCQILGTITANECSFDCSEYVDVLMYAPHNNKVYQDYKDNMEYCLSPLDSFKSMIEAETDFLFENPIENPNPKPLAYFGAIDLKIDEIEVWGKHQDRVIEKLLILKTI